MIPRNAHAGLPVRLIICFIILSIFELHSFSHAQTKAKADSAILHRILSEVKKNENSAEQILPDASLPEIIQLVKDLGKEKDLIDLFNQIGEDFRKSGNYGKSIRYHQKALALSVDIQNPSLEAISLNNIGTVYRRLDDYKQAMTYHVKALRISDSLDDKHSTAIALNSIGNIHYLNGNLEEAKRSFEYSIKLEREIGSKLGIAINLNNIGNVYKSKGDYVSALKYYGESLEYNSLIKSDKGIGICLSDLGKIFLELKEPNNALDHFQESLKLFQTVNEVHYIGECHLNIAQAYLEMRMYDSAIIHLERVLIINNKLRSRSQIYEAHKALGLVFKSLGNFRLALSHSETAFIYRDSIINENSQRSIANMQTVYETEKNRKEIELLKSLDDFNKLIIQRQRLIFSLAIAIVFLIGLFAYLGYINKRKSAKILARKNAEIEEARNELQKHAIDLVIARDKAQDANRAKTEFLANMSHEIRTPLNSILGFSEILKNRPLDDKGVKYVSAITSSGKILLTIINDILDLARVEAGKLEILISQMNFKRVLEDLYTIFSSKANEKSLKLSIITDPDFPKIIFMDEIRFRQIMFNLIGNAVNYTKEGFVEIRSSFHIIDNERMQMIISISDTGPGIDESEKEKVFEKFYRGSDPNVKGSQGTGLGLSITKRLVQILGGTIILDSQKGIGSTFSLHFGNIRYSNEFSDELESNNSEFQSSMIFYRGKKLLAVDDIKLNRDLISGMLEGSGIEIIEASNGIEACEKALIHQPDLILMDVRMPVLNGIEANIRIKNHPPTADIPVIAVSASGMGSEIDEIHHQSFSDFLLKPVQINDLYSLIDKYFKKFPDGSPPVV